MATSGPQTNEAPIRIVRAQPKDQNGTDTNSKDDKQITFKCRVAELKYDPNTTTSSHTDPNGKVTTSTSTTHRISFVAGNVDFIRGNQDLFRTLPSEFFVVVLPADQPLLQWEGRDAEVTGSEYTDGVFDAESIFIPSLNYRIDEPKSGGAGWVLFLLVAAVIAAAVYFWNQGT